MAKTSPKKEKITFEQSMAELDDILAKISDESTGLDDSIALYARAAEILKTCHATLQDAAIKIEEIDLSIKQLEENT